MGSVFDVAEYILKCQGPISAMKLQKLVYYAQAWSLVWDDKPLFRARIEAWANGPVVPALYKKHQGEFRVARGLTDGDWKNLKASERHTIKQVLDYYGDKTPQWLSDLTHAEDPWKNARKGLSPGDRGNREITLESMAEYYGSL